MNPPTISSLKLFLLLEDLRLKICSVGLNPIHHETPEKAADAVCEMIANLRRDLADPPHDVQGRVLRKLGVEGHVREDLGDKPATCKIVSLGAPVSSQMNCSPEIVPARKDSIVAAIDALHEGIEYINEMLEFHDRDQGREYRSRRLIAEGMEASIRRMDAAKAVLGKLLQ